ncbi:SWIM zinc finger family protein [Acetobacterium malicum]|uniref:SWIM zinc finger family protein n=1 Tax=Acetobacterium malicum TaxID=52692 RepID=UPI0035938D9B
MSFYDYDYVHVSVAQKKEKARKSLEQLKRTMPEIEPVDIEGPTIAKTWWGKAWNKNLESYADYSNRIGRGRSYVRQGAVLHLKIDSGTIHALVQGSTAKPYQVEIGIDPLDEKTWKQITALCNRRIESLEQLVSGKFPKELERLFTTRQEGLFPAPEEIHFHCSCPDSARLCKHVAAVLYGAGARLDQNPMLLFSLRKMPVAELIKKSIEEKMDSMLKNADKKSPRVIGDDQVFDLFGV